MRGGEHPPTPPPIQHPGPQTWTATTSVSSTVLSRPGAGPASPAAGKEGLALPHLSCRQLSHTHKEGCLKTLLLCTLYSHRVPGCRSDFTPARPPETDRYHYTTQIQACWSEPTYAQPMEPGRALSLLCDCVTLPGISRGAVQDLCFLCGKPNH